MQIVGSKKDISATDALAGVQLKRDFMGSNVLRFLLDGKELIRTPGTTVADRGAMESNFDTRMTELVIEDLAVIQRELGVRLSIPDELDVKERLSIRIARLLLDGHCVIHPSLTRINVTLDEEGASAVSARFQAEGGSYYSDMLRMPIEVCGKKLSLGHARFAIENGIIVDVDQLAARVESKSLVGSTVSIAPSKNQGMKVFLVDRLKSAGQRTPVTPWGIEGIQEHPELRGITRPPSIPSTLSD